MKCFIHQNEEAIATCRICGKAMCANCSAYSGHSGKCPICRKEEFMMEREDMQAEMNSCLLGIIAWSILSIILAITIIGLIVGIVKILNRVKRRKKAQARIAYLTKEINKLNKALETGEILI